MDKLALASHKITAIERKAQKRPFNLLRINTRIFATSTTSTEK